MIFIEKVQFFEEKFKDENQAKKAIEENLWRFEEKYKKIMKEKDILEQEIQSLKDKILGFSHENYENPFDKLENSKLQEENRELKGKISEFKEKTGNFTEENKRNLQEIQILQRKIQEKELEIQKLEEFKGENQKKITNLKEENEYLKKKLENSKEKNKEKNAEKKEKFSMEKFDFSNLEEKIRDKNDEISGKEIKIAKLEKNFRCLEIEFEKKTEEIRRFETDKHDILQKITAFKRKFKENKDKFIRNLQRKVENYKKEIDDLKLFVKKNVKTFQFDMKTQLNFYANSLKNSLKKREVLYEEKLKERSIEKDDFLLTKQFSFEKKHYEEELQSLLKENTRLKTENKMKFKEENTKEKLEIQVLKEENSSLQAEFRILQEKLRILQEKTFEKNSSKLDKGEENKRLLNELMQLRAAIDTLYTKHKQILEEVTLDIERLKEKQTEEISHINQNYTEMINLMTEKLEYFKRDETNKSSNLVKMSQRIEILEKVNKQLENKLNYSAELPINENLVKSYESPSLKSNRNPTIENSRILNNKSLGDIEKIYESFEPKDSKSEIMETHLNYYGQSNNNKNNNNNILYSSISRGEDPNNLSYLIMNDEKKIKQFNSFDQNNANSMVKPAQLSQREVDELKNLLAFTYKNVEDNKETTKKFMEEADNLTDKVKELQKMHEFIGNSSFIKKYQSMSALHRGTKSHDSPEFPNYTEKLAQLYSPISVKPSLDREDQINMKI